MRSSIKDTQVFCRDYSAELPTSTKCVRCVPCRRKRRAQRQRTIHKCHDCRQLTTLRGGQIRCENCRKIYLQTRPTLICINCGEKFISRNQLASCNDCRQRRTSNQQPQYPTAYTSSSNTRAPLDIGRMDIECKECKALHWKAENSGYDKEKGTPLFESCCKKGSVKLNALLEPPEPLRNLLSSNESSVRRF